MALEQSGLPQLSQDGKYAWYTDKTGEFNVDSNPGGWGAPNFNLNQSALLAFAYRMSNPKAKLVPVGSQIKYSASYTNDQELQFQFDYLNDGYHQFYSCRLMASSDDVQSLDSTPIVFTEGDIWYNTVTGEVKQLTAGGIVTLDLDDTDVLDAIYESDSVNALLCEIMFYGKLAIKKNEKYTLMREARRLEDKKQVTKLREDGTDIMYGMAQAQYQFAFGLKIEAHDTVESLLDDFNIAA